MKLQTLTVYGNYHKEIRRQISPICYSRPKETLYPTGSLVAQYHQHYRLYARLNIEWVTRYYQVQRST
jgi:hypothetical protein